MGFDDERRMPVTLRRACAAKWSVASVAAAVTAAGAGVVAIVTGVLGALATVPLVQRGWWQPLHVVLAACAAVALLTMPRGRWRCAAPWVFLVHAVLLLAWMPYALSITVDPRAGAREVLQLREALLFAAVVVAAARASRAGVTGIRIGWAIALVISCSIGLWELLTLQHLSTGRPWAFGPGRIAAGTFGNPNNFATALVAMIVGTLALRAQLADSTGRRVHRAALDALVALGCIVVLFAQSRTGLLLLVSVLGLEAWRRAWAWRRPTEREPARPVVRWAGAGGAAGAAVLVALTFVVPGLAADNPLRQLWSTAFTSHTAASDRLRAELLLASMRYLRESGYAGPAPDRSRRCCSPTRTPASPSSPTCTTRSPSYSASTAWSSAARTCWGSRCSSGCVWPAASACADRAWGATCGSRWVGTCSPSSRSVVWPARRCLTRRGG